MSRHLLPACVLRRRWSAIVLLALVAVMSVWVSLKVTPPASVTLGIVQARISAAPGSGAVVGTTLGRPITDDTINRGPLQVHVAIAIDRAHPTPEPRVLAAIRQARPRAIHAVVGYLLRVAATALILAALVTLVLFGAAWRRLALVTATVLAVLVGGVAATAATTRFAAFDAASCAHGWSRYALADLSALTPPAPVVSVPTAVADAEAEGLIPVVLISDAHLNPEGLDFARALQTATHARAVLDAGDTTSYGVAGETCVVVPIIRSFRVPYVWVRGNHDSADFERAMRSIRTVRVLDGNETEVAGITVFGVGDPSFTPRRPSAKGVMEEQADEVRATITQTMVQAGPVLPDVVLVHDCRMAEADDPSLPGVAGLTPLVACGHLHRYAETQVRGTTVLHTGTVGAGGLNAFATGQLRDFDAQLLFFSPDAPHRLVRYFDVSGAGGSAARFVEHVPAMSPFAAHPDSSRSGM